MHLVYIDDSRDEHLCAFSALAIPEAQWNDAFSQIRDFRRPLKKNDGIFVYAELHAWKFVSGRGRISSKIVTKWRRCQIFQETLVLITQLPGARLFNAVFPTNQHMRAFERLLNRINRTMEDWGSYAILICDEGKEIEWTRLVRKMRVYNPIPSRYGSWPDTGKPFKNIPINNILEDPFFKRSEQSYFLQLVDFCAFALLKRETITPSKVVQRYGINNAFDVLEPICVKEANRNDQMGIIRP